MRSRRRATALLAVLLLLAVAPRSAGSHPFDAEFVPPHDYAGAVHAISDELAGIRRSRAQGDRADLATRATRLANVAAGAPGFAMSLPGADTLTAAIVRASVGLRAAAEAMRRAAGDGDLDQVGVVAGRCEALLAVLDAAVPARYVCPMHCEKRTYDRPGDCPVCGMTLQRITGDRYDVEVNPGGPLRAGVPVTLAFQVRDPAGFAARDLEVVHEKLLHLIVVSSDLARFDHVHPVPGPDGSFTLRYTFPEPGRWVLFHDFTPARAGLQVVPVDLVVEGAEPARRPLVVDDRATRHVDGCDVTLTHGELRPDADCTLTFNLARHGKPVTDLEPFLGAAGHLVLISGDLGSYVHSHPAAGAPPGPAVEFRVRFDRSGVYKAWGQFQRRGRVITVPFVVEVNADARATRVVK